MELRTLLKDARGERSQADIAAQLGVSQPLIAKWEAGDCMPSLGSVALVAKVYGISARRLRSIIIGRIESRRRVA